MRNRRQCIRAFRQNARFPVVLRAVSIEVVVNIPFYDICTIPVRAVYDTIMPSSFRVRKAALQYLSCQDPLIPFSTFLNVPLLILLL